jgi:hypothetical protein
MANHDQPRMVSKFGNETPEFRAISSKNVIYVCTDNERYEFLLF